MVDRLFKKVKLLCTKDMTCTALLEAYTLIYGRNYCSVCYLIIQFGHLENYFVGINCSYLGWGLGHIYLVSRSHFYYV